MGRYAVELSPEAFAHVEVIREWWLANRQTSPSYHIYYWPDEAALVVRVYAVWYGGRGEGPKL